MAIRRYAGDRFFGTSGDVKPTGVLAGAVFIESGTLASYVYLGGGSTGWTADHPIIEEYYTVPSGLPSGTLINLPNGRTYSTGYNKLRIYVEGQLQRKDTSTVNDYIEYSTSQISFNYALPTDAQVTFVLFS